MIRYLVVGSGATGVHVAQTLLERGESVTMLDVGYQRPAAPLPDADFSTLKSTLPDIERFLLGDQGQAVVYPEPGAKPYGFPPSRAYVFRRPGGMHTEERGFAPLLSFARGGLAEAWTGGSYELRDEELALFPFDPGSLRPHYAVVANRIGVAASSDDLEYHSPLTAGYLAPLAPDAHSVHLLARYGERRDRVGALGVRLGRSRVAVLSQDLGDRRACGNLGRCLWGCPRDSLYAPSQTLSQLLQSPRFTYQDGVLVRSVLLRPDGGVRGVLLADLSGGSESELAAERVILAAGALSTTGIYLETLAGQGRAAVALDGLMDNRHAMVPFLTPARIGAESPLAAYQFHMLALGVDRGGPLEDAHGQISTLKAAMVHPIVSGLPFDLRTSLEIFRRIRAGLGVANIWLPDTRRRGNQVRLERHPAGGTRLVLEYAETESGPDPMDGLVATVRKALSALGCVAPRGMVRVLPRGSSVHYAGTLPMTTAEDEHTLRADGSVRGLPGLYVADGAGFPWLPAKNLTFTLMANASRIAAGMD